MCKKVSTLSYASLVTVVAAPFFTGCSPKVYTRIETIFPSRPAGSPVLVYEIEETPPARTEVLGDIQIGDTGFSTGCQYDQVLRTAKDETNKIGGNGLHLTWHKRPSVFGSSCHQITADMLRLSDSVYRSAYPDYDTEQARQTVLYTASSGSAPTDTRTVESSDRQNSTLILNAGYAFITSKFDILEGYSGDPTSGLDINAAYQWTGRSGFGFGLRYSGYFTSISGADEKLSIGLHYAAPEFVVREEYGRRWVLHGSFGVGYACYRESLDRISVSFSGYGFHAEAGAEYKLSKSVGIGIALGAYNARIKEADKLMKKYTENAKAAITRISFNGGLRVHF